MLTSLAFLREDCHCCCSYFSCIIRKLAPVIISMESDLICSSETWHTFAAILIATRISTKKVSIPHRPAGSSFTNLENNKHCMKQSNAQYRKSEADTTLHLKKLSNFIPNSSGKRLWMEKRDQPWMFFLLVIIQDLILYLVHYGSLPLNAIPVWCLLVMCNHRTNACSLGWRHSLKNQRGDSLRKWSRRGIANRWAGTTSFMPYIEFPALSCSCQLESNLSMAFYID